ANRRADRLRSPWSSDRDGAMSLFIITSCPVPSRRAPTSQSSSAESSLQPKKVGVRWGLYKLPDLFGSMGNGIRGQVLVGSIAAGIAAYLTVRFLMRYFETRTLMPFAIFCLIEGAVCTI